MSWWVLALLAQDPRAELAKEVRGKGWIVVGARTEKGDWDIFLMRPDGSDRRNITNTPQHNEGLPRFSPDGKTILYRRVPRDERFDNNRHGMQGELVFANADGTEAAALGKDGEFSWASWGPDAKRIACLSAKEVSFVDIATRKVVGRTERKGLFQQMTWSPDGKSLIGVSNGFGTGWSVARMDLATGAVNAVSKVDCCTPDWFPDSRNVIFSNRPGQWTQLWMADASGANRTLLYAEEGRHVYGGCVSPDGKYFLFTGNKQEDGDPENAGSPMALMRFRDAPRGPALILPPGWEPHWTSVELTVKK